MLDPTSRRLLFDALRPPDGYTLDVAIGTTYTLDLLALIAAPLAFTFNEWEDRDGSPTLDPVALLQSLRMNASRIRIFHQWGRIHVPTKYERLFHYLEDSLVAVRPHHDQGVFHAKVWVLRYVRESGPVLYRFLNLSRNLTFDSSWDLAIAFDGELRMRSRAFTVNHPLGDFIAALPQLAKEKVTDETLGIVGKVQDEIRRVEFVIPDDFDEVRFWPLGLNGRSQWPFRERKDRVLVLSPFISDSILSRFTNEVAKPQESILISRADELCSLATGVREQFGQSLVLSAGARAEPDDGAESSLSGLHAKMYINESGWDAHVWVGSANATASAFSNNVEFLVELVGKRSRVGIDSFLNGDNGDTSIRSMLEPFGVPENVPDEAEAEKRLDTLLDEAEKQLAARTLCLQIEEREGLYCCELTTDDPVTFRSEVVGECWPISAPARKAPITADLRTPARFGALAFENLTPFIVFSLSATIESVTRTRQFVVSVSMVGTPADRKQRIIRSILSDRKTLMRLLYMLLSNESLNPATMAGTTAGEAGGGKEQSFIDQPGLLEAMLQCLAHNPSKLRDVAKILEELGAQGSDVLPEKFISIWQPIWDAFLAMQEAQ